MAIEFTEHSLWLSSSPTTNADPSPNQKDRESTWQKYSNPPDNSFFYLGGNSSVSYSNTYNASVIGVYEQGTSGAYFVDSATGSISNISVSATRVQPTSPDDSDINKCSNAKVIELLRRMKNSAQLTQGAYIFRMYNNTQKLSCYGKAYDIPVFLDNYTITSSLDNPNTITISLKFIKRSPVLGLNIGKTTY